MPSPFLRIRPEPLASGVARGLIARLDAELSGTYPEPGATHFRLDEQEVGEERGAFLVAYRGTEPVGCGAIRRIDRGTAELKRMFVVPEARGAGIGRALLRALEREAARIGAVTVVLETGIRQKAALALYASAGFEPVPAFGEYVDSPLSVCLGKRLTE